jgi:hypothetical protein
LFCEPRKRKTHGPKIIGHTHQRSYGDQRPQSRFSAIDSAARPQYRQVVADCGKLITFVMRYTVLHAFLTYRIYKRLYLSALNLVNFLKTPCTTSPGRVCVVFRCRRFTRTQSSRNSAQPFLFWHRGCALFCWIYGFTRTSGVTDSAALFFFDTNESICPHSCRCNRIICGGRMLSDNRILHTKESCVTFFLPPFFFTFSVRNIFRTSGRPSSSAA